MTSNTRQRQLSLLQRELAAVESRDSMIKYAQFMMPDIADPDDVMRSAYHVEKHHRVICNALQKVESGEWKRLVISLPPRAGKSLLASQFFPSWFIGKDPSRSVIMSSYNSTMAQEFGRAVKHLMQLPLYNQVFPDASLRKASASNERLQTDDGGIIFSVGRGSSLTGRGADVLIVDDITKDAVEARSITTRDAIWQWYTKVAQTRLMSDEGRIVIIQTRWNVDDLVGRLTDPTNDHFVQEEADKWKILNIPAIAGENDPLGRRVGRPLWPSRFSLKFLEAIRTQDAQGFEALYQGNPTPAEGILIAEGYIKTYRMDQLPKERLRFYMTGDFAISTAQTADKTCILVFGVDDRGMVWIMPQIYWQRSPADKTVDAIIDMMSEYKPTLAFFEKGHISLSLGPAIRKRMAERNIYCGIREISPSRDKVTRAQGTINRMALGKILFPSFTPWYNDAKTEMLHFPSGQHDDFVDAIGLIGQALDVVAPGIAKAKESDVIEIGSMAWVKQASNEEAKRKKYTDMSRGW